MKHSRLPTATDMHYFRFLYDRAEALLRRCTCADETLRLELNPTDQSCSAAGARMKGLSLHIAMIPSSFAFISHEARNATVTQRTTCEVCFLRAIFLPESYPVKWASPLTP